MGDGLKQFSQSSISLITVCQAAHWLDLPPFFVECKRVLRPNGVLALIVYSLPQVHVSNGSAKCDEEINSAIAEVL